MSNTVKSVPLKNWQNYFIKSDPTYGTLIASILQTVYKNKYVSFLNLIKKIDSNPSALISGEGAIELLSRYTDPLKIVPKYYISYQSTDYDDPEVIDRFFVENYLAIRCDFLVILDPAKVTGLSEDYVRSINDTLTIVKKNNDNILINYFLKLISEGQFFIPQEMMEKGVFDEKVPLTKYTVKGIFTKFKILEYNTFYELLKSSNRNANTNDIASNIKMVNVPFTAYHIDNYLTKTYQDICRKKYGIGKNELHVKLLYLNSDYVLENSGKTIYDLLAEDTYFQFFYDNKEDDDDIDSAGIFTSMKEKLFSEIELLYQEIFKNISKKKSDDSEIFLDDMSLEPGVPSGPKENTKRQILKILKSDKVPTRELAILNSIDVDRLQIKKTFIDALTNLSNPFLNKIIDITYIKLLRQYLVTNYGETFKDNVNNEVSELILKKLGDYIQSQNSAFIEFFYSMVRNLAEATGEKEALVENVVQNSLIYRNFFFIKYIHHPRKFQEMSLKNFLSIMNKEAFMIKNDGEEDHKLVIPFMKIKEFLTYLLTAEINYAWEKLSTLFDEIIPIVNAQIYQAELNWMTISMFNVGGNYNITIKDRKQVRDFEIKNLDEIEYVFQDYNQEELKELIIELYHLHHKTGFGFSNRRDFNELLHLYYKRQSEYLVYKKKADKLDRKTSSGNFLLSIIMKILFWLPRSLNDYYLSKVMNKNLNLEKKVDFFYLAKKNDTGIYKEDAEMIDIKERISSFIDYNKKIEDSILGNTKKETKKNHNKKVKKTKKSSDLPPLEEVDVREERLFLFIKKYLDKKKTVIFTHNPNLQDESVVIHVKESGQPAFLQQRDEKLNTIDEMSTRYLIIKTLIKKHYLVQKEYLSLERDKKMYALFLSRSFLHYSQPEL